MVLNAWSDNPARTWLLNNVLSPAGQIFLQSLFMVVVPLVFSSLTTGVTRLGETAQVGRMAARLGVFYTLTTLIAIAIGQTLVTVFQPGAGISPGLVEQARQGFSEQVAGFAEKSGQVGESLWPGIISTVIPRNILSEMSKGNMLSVIFVSLLGGAALLRLPRETAGPAIGILESVSEVCMIVVRWIMRIAPYAVAALMAGAVARFGVAMMGNVLKYLLVVVAGFACQLLVVYAVLVRFGARLPVADFYRRAFPAITTAFSTSSSNATIPATIDTLEKGFGVPKPLATFSVPLGATVNMDGTALFEVVAALFVAQVFGVELTAQAHLTLVVLVLVTSVGVAGIPGGSIPILMSAMASMGVPPEGIALVLGVDRLLDMGRTAVNVTGDMVAALWLARTEGVKLEPADTKTVFAGKGPAGQEIDS